MSQDQRKAQLTQAAIKYFEGLASKNFDLIPYDEGVSLRAPLTPGGMHNPLVGKENLRAVWESEAAFAKFRESRLGPAFVKVGGIPEPRVTTFQVYNRYSAG